MPYWDERVDAMAKQYPQIQADKQHVDILAARFVLQPERFDVVVASNLFGDILSDLGPACTGTIGLAASANLNQKENFHHCLNLSMVQHQIFTVNKLPTQSLRSGRVP